MQRTRDERARILVVEESPVFGQAIADLLSHTPELTSVGPAGDAASAIELFQQFRPDAVALGMHLPSSELLAALHRMLVLRPTPILAMSDDTPVGAALTVEALQCGALDFVILPKHGHECDFRLRDELRAKFRGLLSCDLDSQLASPTLDRRLQATSARARAALATCAAVEHQTRDADQRMIVISAGAGGPRALLQLFKQLRSPLPSIVISQRLPASLLAALAQRLDSLSAIRCKVAENGDILSPNTAYLTPADRQTVVLRHNGHPRLLVHADAASPAVHPGPSSDVLMQSAAMAYGGKCLGMLLTGNGRDGVAGARAIGVAGGFVLGQDEASSFAYGVCQIARSLNYIDRQFHLDDAAEALTAVAPYLGRPEISIVRCPIVDPGSLHACAT